MWRGSPCSEWRPRKGEGGLFLSANLGTQLVGREDLLQALRFQGRCPGQAPRGEAVRSRKAPECPCPNSQTKDNHQNRWGGGGLGGGVDLTFFFTCG